MIWITYPIAPTRNGSNRLRAASERLHLGRFKSAIGDERLINMNTDHLADDELSLELHAIKISLAKGLFLR
ncbi:MAG: hypothetical protein INF79_19500 [Roseomonas sp.]|nr:hypothetical protein [Roseomonas sp.]